MTKLSSLKRKPRMTKSYKKKYSSIKSKKSSQKNKKTKSTKKKRTKYYQAFAQHKIMIINMDMVETKHRIDRKKVFEYLNEAKEDGMNYLVMDDSYDTGYTLYDVKTRKKLKEQHSIISKVYKIKEDLVPYKKKKKKK